MILFEKPKKHDCQCSSCGKETVTVLRIQHNDGSSTIVKLCSECLSHISKHLNKKDNDAIAKIKDVVYGWDGLEDTYNHMMKIDEILGEMGCLNE